MSVLKTKEPHQGQTRLSTGEIGPESEYHSKLKGHFAFTIRGEAPLQPHDSSGCENQISTKPC